MKEKITVQGKSLIFNLIFVLLNLTGLTLMVLGFHEKFEEQATLYRLLGTILMLLSISGLIIFRGKYLMSSVSRVIVGGLFIVSGLVKANDPIGFSYKLEEYFEDGALAFRIKEWFSAPGFSMEFFMDYALLLSVVICIAEIVLGVLTIIGGKIKLVSYSMLLMMIFFTFLTWHTANCDGTVKFVDRDTYAMTDPIAQMKIDEAKDNNEITIVSQTATELVVDEMKMPQCVDDCGCFGDAMKGSVGRSLTPNESFWKDIVLVYLVLWIFVAQFVIKPNTRKENMIFVATSMIVIIFFSWIFGWYFPVFFGLASLIGALWVLRVGGKFLGNYYGVALFVSMLCGVMVWYVLSYLPLKDYRAYAVGSNLIEKMNDGVEGVYESMLVYKNTKTGELVEYSATSTEYNESKIWDDKDWAYESMVQKAIVPTKIPSITDQFNPFIGIDEVSNNEMKLDSVAIQMAALNIPGLRLNDVYGETEVEIPMNEFNLTDYDSESFIILDTITIKNPNITEISIRDYIIHADRFVLVSSKNLDEADWRNIDKLKEIQIACEEAKIPFVMMCSASRDRINEFKRKHNFTAPIFVNDETELKAISRSNPSLLVIEKSVVKGKYSFRSTPTKKEFIIKHLN
ncbi:MAG: DoxX family membrane protein [Crocinitomicaceae bacterium]|nr:DoxX family membrane protein [Crocinitomicaceae bacterium]